MSKVKKKDVDGEKIDLSLVMDCCLSSLWTMHTLNTEHLDNRECEQLWMTTKVMNESLWKSFGNE